MLDPPLLLALDAGTASGRAVVFDAAGRLVSSARRAWRASAPVELAPFGREYDPATLWRLLSESAREALSRVDPARVAAVAATGQRIACAFVDADGETSYLGPNRDIRALDGAPLDALDEDALFRLTGRFPPWICAPARLLWFRARRPTELARVRHVLGMPDWVAYRLSGELATDPSTAADLMMLDVGSRAAAPPSGEGLPDGLWPAVREPGERLGTLRPEAAEELGLPSGIPVAVGGGDTQLALLGAGVVDRGTALVAGSSAPLLRVTAEPLWDPAGRLWTDPHVPTDRWLLEANLGEMGTRHRWMLETFGVDLLERDDPYAAHDALASQAPVGCRGASGHLGPRAMDLRDLNSGRPAGLLMPFGETTLIGPRRPELLRAYLESCAFAARAGRAWLDAVAGSDDGPLTVAGGMSASPLLCEILASVLRREVIGGYTEASALGAAMCAAVVAGLASDPSEAAERMAAHGGRRHAPDDEDAEAYDDAFELWLEREQELEGF